MHSEPFKTCESETLQKIKEAGRIAEPSGAEEASPPHRWVEDVAGCNNGKVQSRPHFPDENAAGELQMNGQGHGHARIQPVLN